MPDIDKLPLRYLAVVVYERQVWEIGPLHYFNAVDLMQRASQQKHCTAWVEEVDHAA